METQAAEGAPDRCGQGAVVHPADHEPKVVLALDRGDAVHLLVQTHLREQEISEAAKTLRIENATVPYSRKSVGCIF